MPRYYGAIKESFNHKNFIKVYQPIRRPEKMVAGEQDSHREKSLKCYVSQVYDKGQINSSTANALCPVYSINQSKTGSCLHFDPSRLFLYYNSRHIKKTTKKDTGATISDIIKAFDKNGMCSEALWPYYKDRVTITPDQEAYTNTGGIITHSLQLIPELQTLKNWIDTGHPFVFAFTVYSRCFDEAGRKGVLPLPTAEEKMKQPDGYHAVMAIEYCDESNSFLILNSYRQEWGREGYFLMPYAFITDQDMCYDFWTITFDTEHHRRQPERQAWLPLLVAVSLLVPVLGMELYILFR